MALVFLPSVCYSGSLFPDTFDRQFKAATLLYLPPGTDWRLLKAQCYQESRLNPFAVSPVGAMGLCQFMPGTWTDVMKHDASLKDPWFPDNSIMAAAWYMGQLHRTWSADRSNIERYMVSAASYNTGAGNMIKAQKLCDNKNTYSEIIPCLPDVTGRHSAETIGYVKNIISKWWPMMLLE